MDLSYCIHYCFPEKCFKIIRFFENLVEKSYYQCDTYITYFMLDGYDLK